MYVYTSLTHTLTTLSLSPITYPKVRYILTYKFFQQCYYSLLLAGNPLSFHPKHRLKTVEILSNLINPTSFRLDSKKLSNNEKKAIPRSFTHYPHSSPSLSSGTSSHSPLHTHRHTLIPPPNSHLMIGSSPGHQSDAIVFSKVSHYMEYM